MWTEIPEEFLVETSIRLRSTAAAVCSGQVVQRSQREIFHTQDPSVRREVGES